MAEQKGLTRILPNWVLRGARTARGHSSVVALWKLVRWIPILRRVAADVRGSELALRRKLEHAHRLREFDELLDLSLPRNEKFLATKAAADVVEGMFSDFSMAAMDCFLSLQAEAGIMGNFLEIGAYRGRTAALLGRHLRQRERLVLVDIEDYLDRASVAPFRNQVDFLICSSDKVKEQHPDQFGMPRAYRFIHIDASHAFYPTFEELRLAEEMLSDGGLIALDDFTDPNYPQNAAAIYKYLFTMPTELTIFLASEKAYLCRKEDRFFYASFVLDRFVSEMHSRTIDDCVLARTDKAADFDVFAARQRKPGEEGHFYGLDIYKSYFRTP